MAQKLRLVLRRPTLKLAFRASLIIFAAFLFRQYGGVFEAVLLVALSALIYARPAINNERFYFPAIVAFLLFFLTPSHESVLINLFTAAVFGCVFSLIIGVKNVVFINRKPLYYAVHLSLIAATAFLFFNYNYSILSVGVFFAFVYLLLRNYYATILKYADHTANLSAGIVAFVSMELAWVSMILPVVPLARPILVAVGVIAFGNIIPSLLEKRVSSPIIIGNAVFFSVITAVVLIFVRVAGS